MSHFIDNQFTTRSPPAALLWSTVSQNLRSSFGMTRSRRTRLAHFTIELWYLAARARSEPAQAAARGIGTQSRAAAKQIDERHATFRFDTLISGVGTTERFGKSVSHIVEDARASSGPPYDAALWRSVTYEPPGIFPFHRHGAIAPRPNSLLCEPQPHDLIPDAGSLCAARGDANCIKNAKVTAIADAHDACETAIS